MAALEAIYRWRQTPEIVEVKPEESSEEEKEENQVKASCPIKSDWEELEAKAVSTIRATESQTDSAQVNTKRRYSTGLEMDIEEVTVKEEDDAVDEDREEDMASRPSSTETVAIPLKKRARMMEVPYAIGHVINKCVTPVMPFTFEEEFQVMRIMMKVLFL